MLDLGKVEAMKKIKEEFEHMNRSPNPNIGVTVGLPDPNNIFVWRATLTGPKDSSYKGGVFILNIIFPNDYPMHPPEVCFKTPIYHVNVNPMKDKFGNAERLGHVCISTLNWWKPEYNMNEVLTNIFGLFYMANPDSPYGLDRANELRNNKALYEDKIKFFTKKYANPGYCDINKIYNDSWDFTYN